MGSGRRLAGYHLARAQFGEANRTLRAIAGATSDDTVRAWALHNCLRSAINFLE